MTQPPVFNWATAVGGTVIGGLTLTAAEWIENISQGLVAYGVIEYSCSGSPDLSGVLQGHRLVASGFSSDLNNGTFPIQSVNNSAKTIRVLMTARSNAGADETGASASGEVITSGALLNPPTTAKRGQGYVPNELPNALQLNWMLNSFGKWTNYLATGDAGIIGAADLTALAAIDTTGFTGRAALVAGIGVYRWTSGSALTADGYTVVDSDVSGQWVLEAASPQPVIVDDDLSITHGGRYIANAATKKTLTLPPAIRPGHEIEVVNHGAGGFLLSTNPGQKIRDTNTEYSHTSRVVRAESIEPYGSIRLLATDQNTFTTTNKNGVIIYRDNLLWTQYEKTAFNTTGTSFSLAQSVNFRVANSGSRILALVNVNFSGENTPGRIFISFNGGSQDFVYINQSSSNNGGVIIPRISDVVGAGLHSVEVFIRSESGAVFNGDIQIICHEIESSRFLGQQAFSGLTLNGTNSTNAGALITTFSGSPVILFCGAVQGSATGGSKFVESLPINTAGNTTLGVSSKQSYRPGSGVIATSGFITIVKPGDAGYPSSGQSLAVRLTAGGTQDATGITGRTYAIALPPGLTEFAGGNADVGTLEGSWTTIKSATISLPDDSDLFVSAGIRGGGPRTGRPIYRILVDGVDVTGDVNDSSDMTVSTSVLVSAVAEDVPAGSRTVEFQARRPSGTGGYLYDTQLHVVRIRG